MMAALASGCLKLSIKTELTSSEGKPAQVASPSTPSTTQKTGADFPGGVQDTTMEDMEMSGPPLSQNTATGPIGNAETLPISITGFFNNTSTSGCFPSGQGWNKYYPLPKLLLGPFTSSNSLTYPNIENRNSVTITTLNIGNPAGLETAIVIYPEFAPWDRSCGNTANACESLTRMPTVQGTRYKAVIYYKSSTLPAGTTSVLVRWQYP